MKSLQIKHEVHNYRTLRERLLVNWPEIDDETLTDTLEGITSLREMIAEVTRSALEDQALASGLKMRIGDMKARLDRLHLRASKKRQLALDSMIEADIKTLTQPDFTASARSGTPSIIITSDDHIPEAFWVPQPAKLDRQALLAAMKGGQTIDGAALSNPKPTISIRTK